MKEEDEMALHNVIDDFNQSKYYVQNGMIMSGNPFFVSLGNMLVAAKHEDAVKVYKNWHKEWLEYEQIGKKTYDKLIKVDCLVKY
jgi:hypothetical protein